MLKNYQPKITINSYKKKKKNKTKKIFLYILSVIFILLFLVYVGLNYLIKKQIENISELNQENHYLKREIYKLSTSDKAYEEILRTKYGYIKDGEKIIIYSKSLKK